MTSSARSEMAVRYLITMIALLTLTVNVTSEHVTPEAVTPEAVTPEAVTPEAVTSEAVTPADMTSTHVTRRLLLPHEIPLYLTARPPSEHLRGPKPWQIPHPEYFKQNRNYKSARCSCKPLDIDLTDLIDVMHRSLDEIIPTYFNITHCQVCRCRLFVRLHFMLFGMNRRFHDVLSSTETQTDEFDAKVGEFRKASEIAELWINDIRSLDWCNNGTVMQEFGDAFDTLKTDMNNAVRAMMERTKFQVNWWVRKCIDSLKSHDIENSVHIFEFINDVNKLPIIIKKVYNKDVNNTERISLFLNGLPSTSFDIACRALFEVMNDNNDLEKEQVLMLSYLINKTISSNVSGNADEFNEMKQELTEPIKRLIAGWSYAIQTGRVIQIAKYVEKPFVDFESHLVSLIDHIYDDSPQRSYHIFNFVKELKSTTHIGIAYTALYRKLQTKEDLGGSLIFKLASSVKEKIKEISRTHQEDSRIDELWTNLPSIVRMIVTNKKVCITDVSRTVMLYSSEPFSGMRGIKAHRGIDKDWKNKTWRFDTANEGKTFRILNTDLNEYMFSEIQIVNVFTPVHVGVFVTKPMAADADEHFEWHVELVGDDRFRLMNAFVGFHVYRTDSNLRYLSHEGETVVTARTGKDVTLSEFTVVDCE